MEDQNAYNYEKEVMMKTFGMNDKAALKPITFRRPNGLLIGTTNGKITYGEITVESRMFCYAKTKCKTSNNY